MGKLKEELINPLKINSKLWQDLYDQGKNDLRYPSDVFVRCANKYLGSNVRKVLDYGCGTGANLLHLAQRGMTVSGIEISESALALTQKRIKESNLTADLKLGVPGAPLPWPDNSFDAVIAWQVL